MQAIIDVNLPKFLAPDVPLFNGIVSDLFPGVVLPEIDRKIMRDVVESECKKMGLQTVEYFISKTYVKKSNFYLFFFFHSFFVLHLNV